MKAVVMAGGFGTRIQPLTNSKPKPMLPIMNKPMMEHTMMMLKKIGITEFIVLLYFKPEIIKEYFKDGSDFGIKITYVLPDEDYGTAGAVKLAQEYIGNENFIVISGDLVTDFDFRNLFAFHKEKKSKLSIGLTSVDNPLQFGVVIVNEEGIIEKFLEKPSWGEVFSDTINTGIYVVEPEILEYIPKNENFDFAKDLFPLLMKHEVELMGCNLSGYWRDVGNPESYREVYEDIFAKRIDFPLYGHKESFPDGVLYSEKPYHLDKSIEITGTVVLGKKVTLNNGVKLYNSVIADNVVIDAEAKIRNSVIWENVFIGKKTKLDNTVICNDNSIGKNVTVKAGLILAEGCEIGELSSFERDITVWPDKKIEAASIVSHNIVLGSRYKNSIFENGSVMGTSNVELSCDMATKLAEAFASQLPVGSTVVVGRDDDKNSRMLKRAFLGGLLSAGVHVHDLKSIPQPLLRFTLAKNSQYVAGAQFKRCINDPRNSEITLFDEHAVRINTSAAKVIEKAFFTEKFRRVEHESIGEIFESHYCEECIQYKNSIEECLDQVGSRQSNLRIAVDLMHGNAAKVFPTILNEMGIENIVLNSYYDEQKLSNFVVMKKRSTENMSKIVQSLGYDIGVLIAPNAQTITFITDRGEVLNKIKSLHCILYLLSVTTKENEKKKVFLPTWAPDVLEFDNLIIERGKYTDFTVEQLKRYDFIATVDGNYTFSEFNYTRDALFAILKILELLNASGLKLSEVAKEIDYFYYKTTKVECPQSLKAKMMRKFLESAKGKKSSHLDGVKIWENDTDWILMIPHQYGEYLNLYIQAKDDVVGENLFKQYKEKMADWIAQ
ncbi:sugar phosphate nucleotidyltransferase [Sulfurimonas sp. C5]|uniref:sugar phosphate nucleotidyltransferase n=1 Tax=Sulfurimonas sp. C5 TaxID=3036947 RepID=UPI002453E4B3|nr:sugar phosphate nucleotidyltransferase [Sulfurimonas sp. C5]MDH4944908.1 sugar phosphate nucleotidyltransferase [Sulfurimonas sp. C5]